MTTIITGGRVFAVLCLAGYSLAWAQTAAPVQGIYTCVDSKGRKLTSDRPIAECLDREQKVLNPSGTVKATVGPNLTAQERTELEERKRREEEDRLRQVEEKRRERALLTRYPNKAVHDKERAEALAQIDVVRRAAVNRVTELMRQRDELNAEMEFYKRDPNKAPSYLRRQIEDNANSLSVQGRFIAEQDAEKVRVNARFDDDLNRLRPLWAQQAPSAAPSTKVR